MGYIAKEINRVIGVYHLKSHILSRQYVKMYQFYFMELQFTIIIKEF